MANVTNVVEAATDLNAQSIVFSDKNKQAEKLLGSNESNKDDTATESSSSITPKEFYWDQIMFYLVSSILGLSFLDISVEFFRGSVVQCFTPSDLTRDQISYLNNYCYGSLPDSQYYLIFILISALLMITPHYIWNSYFGAQFEYFFDLVKKLDRLRDIKTGEYVPLSFEIVGKLESEFCKFNTWIFRLYCAKLFGQLLISVCVFLANMLYFNGNDFNESFKCPQTSFLNSLEWPLPEQVTCVYNSLNLLWFLRLAAFILVGTSIFVIAIGIIWCFVRHANELGANLVADFCDASCLSPPEFSFSSFRNIIKGVFNSDRGFRCCSKFSKSFKELFYPRISNDLDFLLMKLYFADTGHGRVFRDIQINRGIRAKKEQDHELLHLLNRMHLDYTKQHREGISSHTQTFQCR